MVGQLGDDDGLTVGAAALLLSLNGGDAAHRHRASARGVGLTNATTANNLCPCGEIGARDVLHQLQAGEFRVINQGDDAIDHFAQIVGRNIGGHAHRNAR